MIYSYHNHFQNMVISLSLNLSIYCKSVYSPSNGYPDLPKNVTSIKRYCISLSFALWNCSESSNRELIKPSNNWLILRQLDPTMFDGCLKNNWTINSQKSFLNKDKLPVFPFFIFLDCCLQFFRQSKIKLILSYYELVIS